MTSTAWKAITTDADRIQLTKSRRCCYSSVRFYAGIDVECIGNAWQGLIFRICYNISTTIYYITIVTTVTAIYGAREILSAVSSRSSAGYVVEVFS